MKPKWRRVLLILGLLFIAIVAIVWLGLPSWLLQDSHPIRNVLEALSWPFAILGVIFMGMPAMLSWIGVKRVSPGRAAEDPVVSDENLYLSRCSYLIDGALPRVNQVSLFGFRVKRAIGTSTDDGSDLPPYVSRDIDDDLEWAVAAGGIVLLHGKAAAGKSRAAAECIRRLRPNHLLLVPKDGPSLRELVELGLVPADTVIFLDDLERYVGAVGLDSDLLRRLISSGVDKSSIVATMREEELSLYNTSLRGDDEASGSVDRSAVELISQIPKSHRISVEPKLSLSEKTRADEISLNDPRIGQAASAKEGFAEYLAAGVAIMQRWEVGDGSLYFVGSALVSAAVDCRRAGYHKPLDQTILYQIYQHYLPSAWAERADLPDISQGLSWANQPVLGASSCLQPMKDNKYVASDYLVDRAQAGEGPLGKFVAEVVWNVLTECVDAQDVHRLALAAWKADKRDIARMAFTKAASAGISSAYVNLGNLLKSLGRTNDAEIAFRRAMAEGNADGAINLGRLLYQEGDIVEAIDILRNAANKGRPRALIHLAEALGKQGDTKEAEDILRAVSQDESVRPFEFILANRILGRILRSQRRLSEAEIVLRTIPEVSVNAYYDLGSLLEELDRTDEAEQLYRNAGKSGNVIARVILARFLRDRGRKAEAFRLEKEVASSDNTAALYNLGSMLLRQGELAPAEEVFGKGSALGCIDCLTQLAHVHMKLNKRQDAIKELEKASAENVLALVDLAYEHEATGDLVKAEEFYRKAAVRGSRKAVLYLGSCLASAGRREEAETQYRQAINMGEIKARAYLGNLLRRESRFEEAENEYLAGIRAGDLTARIGFGILLVEQRRVDEAELQWTSAILIVENPGDDRKSHESEADMNNDNFMADHLKSELNLRAHELLESKEFQKAAALFELALRLLPGDSDLLNNLGFCLVPQDPELALEYLVEAYKAGYSHLCINVCNRVVAYMLCGQYIEALELIEAYWRSDDEQTGTLWMLDGKGIVLREKLLCRRQLALSASMCATAVMNPAAAVYWQQRTSA